ncbi:MAG: DUF393 domain-containing protein [Pseudomonadota bacterium]
MSKTDVLYNAACPICSREIEHYARVSAQGALPIHYDDLNDNEALQGWGVTADDAARQLHVRKDGHLLTGVPAFVALWESLPRYRWLARLVQLPGVFQTATWIYDRLLAPRLYRQHIRRMSRRNQD